MSRTILWNRKARFDYLILETFQAGLNLSGSMVTRILNNKVSLQGKFIIYQKQQLQIIGLGSGQIAENVSLLLKKKEVAEIRKNLQIKGISCIPLEVKRVGRWLKCEIALVKGKKNFDKKQTLKQRDIDRESQLEKKNRSL